MSVPVLLVLSTAYSRVSVFLSTLDGNTFLESASLEVTIFDLMLANKEFELKLPIEIGVAVDSCLVNSDTPELGEITGFASELTWLALLLIPADDLEDLALLVSGVNNLELSVTGV